MQQLYFYMGGYNGGKLSTGGYRESEVLLPKVATTLANELEHGDLHTVSARYLLKVKLYESLNKKRNFIAHVIIRIISHKWTGNVVLEDYFQKREGYNTYTVALI
jgi:hypothetical protein